MALGWPPIQGLVVGIVISIASTMVMVRLLTDRGELHTRHGRVMIGITLVEDLAVVMLIVLIPALGKRDAEGLSAVGLALLQAGAILVPFWLLASRVMPRVLTWVARTRSTELFLLVVLAMALGTAALSQAAGLSLALGAFLAGLLVSESDYAHETFARVLPLRDAFVALFFATIGALVDPEARARESAAPGSDDRTRPRWQPGDMDRRRQSLRLPSPDGPTRRHRPHSDRRVLVHPRPGGP